MKNVATQKETNAAGPDNRSKIVLLVDASQQTGKARILVYDIHHWFSSIVMHWLTTVECTTFHHSRFSSFHLSCHFVKFSRKNETVHVLNILSTCFAGLCTIFEKGLRFPYKIVKQFKNQRWNFADIVEIWGTHFGRNQVCTCSHN